jgi:5-methylcytosine-specific restriction endonuclease McrA
MFEGLMKDPHYLYKGVWYRDTNRLSEEDGTNLLLDYERKLERKLARLRTQSTSEGQDTTREPIPPDTQVFVWNRDGGRCVRCGSQANLEFDHIIPLSKGGSNTARNLQLLCQDCNRTKAGNVGE